MRARDGIIWYKKTTAQNAKNKMTLLLSFHFVHKTLYHLYVSVPRMICVIAVIVEIPSTQTKRKLPILKDEALCDMLYKLLRLY